MKVDGSQLKDDHFELITLHEESSPAVSHTSNLWKELEVILSLDIATDPSAIDKEVQGIF